MEEPKRPGGQLATRPLHFIWIADCSGSMQGEKIAQLNTAIKEALPHMQKVAAENSFAQVLVRAVKFSDGAEWHISSPTAVESFKWADLQADGVTDMGRALKLVAEELKIPPMSERALPPVLVLISDGQATDDFDGGLKSLMDLPWGKRAIRVAVAIGNDTDTDVLQKFIGNPEIKPLQANNPEQLIAKIKWASTEPLKAASSPSSSQIGTSSGSNVALNMPEETGPTPDDVW